MLEKLKGRNLFLVLAILIVLMGIYIRAIMLKHPGFFEPDVYFYYSILRETIQNGFVVPAYSYLSGFPVHNHIGEAPGIVYASAIPYFFLRYIGISYYTVMRLVPIFFGVLTILGTYLLSRRLSKNSWFGLLVLFLAAVSIGSLSRTSGTEYRGDSFISPFLLVSLYLMLKGVEGEGKRTDYHLMLLSAFVLSLGSMVWNGFPYTYATYLMATALISVYAFISGKEKLLRMNSVAVLGLLLAYLLQHLYAYIGLSRSSLPMTGLDFFILYIPVLAGSLLAYYALMDKGRFAVLISHRNRAIAVFACLVISVVLLSGLFAHYYNTIFGQKAIGQTTLELQPTTLSFVASILNIQLLLAPLGILFFLFLAHYAEDKEHHKAWALRLSMSPAFLAIASYVAITGILQGSVLRFNAIFAVPMVIFAAYGMFVPGALMKKYAEGIQGRRMVKTAAAIALAACLLISLYFIMPFSILGSYFVVGAILRAIATAICIIALAYIAYCYFAKRQFALNAYLCLATVLLIYAFYTAYISAYSSNPAGGINSQFLDAMQWMRSNTPANSTVAAVWTDGSVIEGWANRTSYVDSVGGENGTRIEPFNRWLFNTSNDTSFLYSIGRPDYLVSRVFWYAELQGLYVEANLTNITAYTYATLTSLNRTEVNGTTYYRFSSGNNTNGYRAALLVVPGANGTSRFAAFIGTTASDKLILIKKVIFYDTKNYNYSIATTNITNSANYTLLVTYRGSDIVGGTIVGPKLATSNFFKFTVLCNAYACPADTANVTYNAVYINNDSRIFKINYK